MDATTLHYLISLVVSEELIMQLMDVVTAYLYGDLDTEIYMKVPDGLSLPKSSGSRPRSAFAKVATLTIWIELIQTDVVYPSK